jgi:hypothetical protein
MALGLATGAVVAPAVVDSGSLGVPEARADVFNSSCFNASYWSLRNSSCTAVRHAAVVRGVSKPYLGNLARPGQVSDQGACYPNELAYGARSESTQVFWTELV